MSKIRVNEIESTDELTLLTVADIKAAVDAFQSGSAGLSEQQVLDLLVANNYLTQTQIQSLIDAAGTGGGLTEQQVLDILTNNNYLTQSEINTLITNATTNFQDQTEVQSLIDASTVDFLTDLEIQSLIDTATTDFLTQTDINNTVGLDFNARIGDTIISIDGKDQSGTDLSTKGFVERNQDIEVRDNNYFQLNTILENNNSQLSVKFNNDDIVEYSSDDTSQVFVPLGAIDDITMKYGLLLDNANGELQLKTNTGTDIGAATVITPIPSGVIGNATIIDLDFDLYQRGDNYIDIMFYAKGGNAFLYVNIDMSSIEPTINNFNNFSLTSSINCLGVNMYSKNTDGSCSFYGTSDTGIVYDIQIDNTGTEISNNVFIDLVGADYGKAQAIIENELGFVNTPEIVKDKNQSYQGSVRLQGQNRKKMFFSIANIYDTGSVIREQRAGINYSFDTTGDKIKRVYLKENLGGGGDPFQDFVIKTNTIFTSPGLQVDLTIDGSPILSTYTVPNDSGLTYQDFETLYFSSGAAPALNAPVFDPEVGLNYIEFDNFGIEFDIFFDTNFNNSVGDQIETDFVLGTESVDGTGFDVEYFTIEIDHLGAGATTDITTIQDFSKTFVNEENFKSSSAYNNLKINQVFTKSNNSSGNTDYFVFAVKNYNYEFNYEPLMFFMNTDILGSLTGAESGFSGYFEPLYHDSVENSLICQIGSDIRKIKCIIDYKTLGNDTSPLFNASSYEISSEIFNFQSANITGYSEGSFNAYGKNLNEYYTVYYTPSMPVSTPLFYKEQMLYLPSYNESINPADLTFEQIVTNQNLTYIIDLSKFFLLKKLNNGIDRYWTKVN